MGRASFAVLLFQDIAVAPILFGVAVIARQPQRRRNRAWARSAWRSPRQAIGLGAIIGIGRLAVRPLFRSVARTQSPELFLAACLLVIIGAALGASGAGLSAALGALVAGILLAETEYRRQIEVLIEPFKGLFLGVFLISAGMSIDLRVAVAQPVVVFGGAFGLGAGEGSDHFWAGTLVQAAAPHSAPAQP